MNGPGISDAEFFDLLNLDMPALKDVKAAVARGDWTGAKAALVGHIKARTSPRWFFDWQGGPPVGKDYDTALADRFARNELVSVGVWHDFGEEIDWGINPMPNQYKEWTWQLSRHPFWITLGEAYWATGDEKYAKAFVFQLNSWITQNLVPEDSGNYGGSRWRTLETGIRMCRSWFSALYAFLKSPSFDDESVVRMVKSCVEHVRHLIQWPQSANWLATETTGLFYASVMFPEFKEAEAWRNTAVERMYAELDNQVYPDGAQIELASGYHQVSMGDFEKFAKLAQLNGISLPGDFLAKVEKMFHYDLYAATPNGELPALNDGGWVDVAPHCARGFDYYPHRTDMQWMATGGKAGTRPAHDSYLFPWAGHCVMRSGWDPDDRYLLFDIGPFGHGHQHEDKLHFVLYAYGRVHVTDPGNYAYDDSIWRKYHISAYAHNTILVDGLPQNRRGFDRKLYRQPYALDANWESTDAYDYAVGHYNAPGVEVPHPEGYGPDRLTHVTHTRHIVFVKPDYWVVFDTLTPDDDASHRYESPFHLDAEGADADGLRVTTRNREASNLAIVPAAQEGLSLEVITGQEESYVQGWIRDRQYSVRPIPTPTYRLAGTGEQQIAYVFYPIPAGETCPVENVTFAENLGVDTAVQVRMSDGAVHTIAVNPEGKTLTAGGKTSTAHIYLARD